MVYESYKRFQDQHLSIDLYVLMVNQSNIIFYTYIIIENLKRGLLAPHEISNLDVRASELKVENFRQQREQERFLTTSMGKGILVLSLSLIKYRFVA